MQGGQKNTSGQYKKEKIILNTLDELDNKAENIALQTL
jgi:hypothetical protein